MKIIFVVSFFISSLFTSSFAFAHAEQSTAKQAWEKLVGKKFSSRPEFAYIENNTSLPNVLLYGDSISIHYTQQVRELIDAKANVYRLYRNGSDSGGFIAKMDKMYSVMKNNEVQGAWSFDWDVIHFNVGLHDLKYVKDKKLDKENGKLVASIEEYKINLQNIIQYLKSTSPKAVLIFATTTPVPDGEKGRFAGDAVKYNKAALEVLQNHPDIQINNLYELTKPNHSMWWVKEGDVHYNKKGTKAQAIQVSNIILSQNIFN